MSKEITYEELATHNTKEDAWLALNGMVYDVTDYAKKHPGGLPNISKGFGIDATALFNATHPYVKYEKILKGKEMGYLPGFESKRISVSQVPEQGEKKGFFAKLFGLGPKDVVNTQFMETDAKAILTMKGKKVNFDPKNWTVGLLENNKTLFVKYCMESPMVWTNSYKLPAPADSLQVKCDKKDKIVEIQLNKVNKKEKWMSKMNAEVKKMGTTSDSRGSQEMFKGYIVFKENVTHNVVMFGVQVQSTAKIGIPLGFHAKLRVKDKSRRYTPVKFSLVNKPEPKFGDKGDIIYFIIKIYPDGQFTPLLDAVKMDSKQTDSNSIEIGAVGGVLGEKFFEGVQGLLMLAGGTGITPMIQILGYLQENISNLKLQSVVLVFFNQEKKDIIWHAEWNELAKKYKDWFTYFPILTREKVENELGCGQGRICPVLLKDVLNRVLKWKDAKVKKAVVCGTSGFNDACEKAILEACGKMKETFVFEG